jgi:hypothetical protein
LERQCRRLQPGDERPGARSTKARFFFGLAVEPIGTALRAKAWR